MHQTLAILGHPIAMWERSELAVEIVVPIGDRNYGLRDFMVRDPDGFGVRFASFLQGRANQ